MSVLKREKPGERERKNLARALDKIGGKATLDVADKLPVQTSLKVKASIAREESPSTISLDEKIEKVASLQIHLRNRRGLEGFVRQEVESSQQARRLFEVKSSRPGLVELTPLAAFRLSDLLSLRCFGTLAFVLGKIPKPDAAPIAKVLAASSHLLQTLTQGSLRYRLEFPSLGHQRALVREIANRVYALSPDLLNDARSAPWAVEIHPYDGQFLVELRPRLSPDPRFSYRMLDVPAASHPPLAACMARLSGTSGSDAVWDPFFGSGLEFGQPG